MMRIARIVGGNLIVLGFMAFAANLLAIAYDQIHQSIKEATKEDRRASLPNYASHEWAATHFQEFGRLDGRYHAFVGWRRDPFSGETINIGDYGLRATLNAGDATARRVVGFFGGSTMWGSGADDANTIPSRFAREHPGFFAYNFGERGYTARQSLNMLLNAHADGLRSDVVVFYDGVNEIGLKCRRDVRALGHGREQKIRALIHIYGNPISFFGLVQPLAELLRKEFPGDSNDAEHYDCANDPAEADAVARSLLSDWAAAKYLVEGYGGTFLAVLQPVAFLGNPYTNHIEGRLKPSFGRQFEVVYPRIVELLDEAFPMLAENFVDLRDAFDGDEVVYIDYCHVSPNGNAIIAERIADALIARGLIARSGQASDSASRSPSTAKAAAKLRRSQSITPGLEMT